MINFDCFSHGQVTSKMWLCEKLEPYIPEYSNIAILGSWYNLLAFMLKIRGRSNCGLIEGFDIDPKTQEIANKITNTWSISNNIKNTVADVNDVIYDNFDVIINCSVEHMNNQWYQNIKEKSIVCLQSSNISDPNEPWLITNSNSSLKEMEEKYKFKEILYKDELDICYNDWGYTRFMIIGVK